MVAFIFYVTFKKVTLGLQVAFSITEFKPVFHDSHPTNLGNLLTGGESTSIHCSVYYGVCQAIIDYLPTHPQNSKYQLLNYSNLCAIHNRLLYFT